MRGRTALTTARVTLIGLLLLVQAAGVVRARFVEDGLFSWAPHDVHVAYRITAELRGSPLSAREITGRYGLASEGALSHPVGDLYWIVRTMERRRPAGERASVTVVTSRNGAVEKTWTFP